MKIDFLQKIKPYSLDSIALSPSSSMIENKVLSATTKADSAKFNLLMKKIFRKREINENGI